MGTNQMTDTNNGMEPYKAFDDYVKDKPELKTMIGILAQGIQSMNKNLESMHTRQEKMWGDITRIMEILMNKDLIDTPTRSEEM